MREGAALKAFLDNQPVSKIQVAKALGMTKQNLYQLFKSQFLEQETKDKFEGYFKKAIFTEDGQVNISYPIIDKKNPSESQDLKDKLISQLEKNVELQEIRVAAINKAFEEIQVIKEHLERIEKTQLMINAAYRSYQEYWAVQMAPKGQTKQAVIAAIDSRAVALFQEALRDHTSN